ncbi:hypothetical protein HD554DRAFT_2067588 [Boletus coccyginus]|nr:hypothetical protein HD554DRAFT_2067588 [Boletus coccyginus]
MQRILDQLRAHADAAPDNALLTRTIAALLDVQRRPHGPHSVSWDALSRDFQRLRDHNFWEPSTENDELLDALRVLLMSPSHKSPRESVEPHQTPSSGEKVSVVNVIPSPGLSSQLVSNQDHLVLPVELIDVLNNAYFLHILATDPAQILPPGKSLLSVMSRARSTADGDAKPTLHSKVEDIAHKAFWDEAVHTLSSPEPSAQLSRIKLLYKDLHAALSPLFPPNHPVLVTLSSHLSPTSSPLDSALMHLREVLAGLRQRCAPVRDPEIEAFQRSLNDPLIRSFPPVALATLVTDTVRNILRLSEIMKDDLSQFILGAMTEGQLRSVVVKQSNSTEREVVADIWHRDRISQAWATWLDKLKPPVHLSSISAEPHFFWLVRIVQALGSPSPVSCPLPSRTVQISPTEPSDRDSNEKVGSSTPGVNTLPPVFFFSAPALLKIQNYLQALVIAASLRILASFPAPTRSSPASSESSDPDSFMSRVWTLLRAEIGGEPDASDTKLINLADEVVRARTQANATPSTASSTLSQDDEATLRAAIDRTLRYEDPVYKLLQSRLMTELSNVLVKRRQEDAARDVGTGVGPVTLRTGRDGERAGKRPRLVLNLEDHDMGESRTPLRGSTQKVTVVKGFEGPVLSRATSEVFEQVDSCLVWVERVWGDVIETGNVKDVMLPKKGGT